MTICSPCTTSPARRTPRGRGRCLTPTAICLLLAGWLLAACAQEPELPALGVNLSTVSVSGLSSGGYMAGQFQIAHSGIVTGAGLVAAGPYGCAESVLGRVTPLWTATLGQNLNRALNGCSGTSMASLGVPDVARLARRARERAREEAIAPLDGLAGDRVYLFAGGADRTVAPSLARDARALYERLGVAPVDIAFVENAGAGHGFLVEQGGTSCGATEQPFLNNCGYDQAGAILEHVYGPLRAPGDGAGGELLRFAQDAYADDDAEMGETGAVFVPETCVREPGCRVHVVFHGCRQSLSAVGEAFVEGAGYNRWAAANRTVVLYPQATDSISNPRGCWDWWGYTGSAFLTRDAPQIRAVKAMLDRLGEQAR